MSKLNSVAAISNALTNWYALNKRDLPWRNTNNPYKIWISEIILQQTRVNQGKDYYNRFIERFPTIYELASASEDDVLKQWQGLGYYSRARNLYKAAQQIVNQNNGNFPINHSEVLQLSGIGDYTAAAICSLAYNQPFAVVDGNVYRVLARLFGINTPIDSSEGKKLFASLAQKLLSNSEPAIHNQAIMEFGALQCVPVSPNCEICPLLSACEAFNTNQVSNLPLKSIKTKTLNRYFNYLFIRHNENTFLQKRKAKDIWQNLYEFPLIESINPLEMSEIVTNEHFIKLFEGTEKVNILNVTSPLKHVLSHRIIYAQFISIIVSNTNIKLNELIKVPVNDIEQYAVSRLMELFLEKM